MKYSRFEELPVWNAAIEFAVNVFKLTSKPQFKGFYSLKDQLERAAVSISNNIAEGFERGTNKELLAFLYISRGSAGECRSMLTLLERMPDFVEIKSDMAGLKSRAESTSKQLKAWIDSLQNSDYKGQRFVNEKIRHDEQKRKEYEEWRNELKQMVEEAQREREAKYKSQQEDKTKDED